MFSEQGLSRSKNGKSFKGIQCFRNRLKLELVYAKNLAECDKQQNKAVRNISTPSSHSAVRPIFCVK